VSFCLLTQRSASHGDRDRINQIRGSGSAQLRPQPDGLLLGQRSGLSRQRHNSARTGRKATLALLTFAGGLLGLASLAPSSVAVAQAAGPSPAQSAGSTAAVAAAVNPANNRQYVFWRGEDGRIYEAWHTGGRHGPLNKGWTSPSAPSTAVTTSSHQYVLWRGANSHIYEAWYTNGWHGPLDLTSTLRLGTAGLTTSTPAVGVNPVSGRQYVFWRGVNRRIYEAWYTTGWHGPANMGSSSRCRPQPGSRTSGCTESVHVSPASATLKSRSR
jgi:hypothetical protein